MSDVTDNLPSYPTGLDIYPESYKIRIDASMLHPVGIADKSEAYKTAFQTIITRGDSLLSADDDGKQCFVLADLFIVYLEEDAEGVYVVLKDGSTIRVTDSASLNTALNKYVKDCRKEVEEAAKDKAAHDAAEAAGAVMYDHSVLSDISVSDLVAMQEGRQ